MLVGYVLRHDLGAQHFFECLKSKKLVKCSMPESNVAPIFPEWRIEQDYRESVSARTESRRGGPFGT